MSSILGELTFDSTSDTTAVIIIINESTWTTETYKVNQKGIYNFNTLSSNKKLVAAITDRGESFAYGNVTPSEV